jgi:hypothetical protein
MDPTSLALVAPDIEVLECLAHDTHASVASVIMDTVAIVGCCESLLDAVEAKIGRLWT